MFASKVGIIAFGLAALFVIVSASHCAEKSLCDGLELHTFTAAEEPKEAFLQDMRIRFCGCRVVDGSININRPENELYNSKDFKFLSSVEEIGDSLFIQNLNISDHITLPNLQLIRGRNLVDNTISPTRHPALLIHNVTGPVYLPNLTEISIGDVYIVTVSSCNHRGVLWEGILTDPNSQYQELGNDHCPSRDAIINRDCPHCESRYCWSSNYCQTLTKNFGTCFEVCSTRRCYLDTMGNPQCCSRECAAGCVGPNDNQGTTCKNYNNNGVRMCY
ncbi:epidermal growth factor receptor-like isoform X3 [Dysidea avara]|uniref:epidermal growth factor receptor-like isoform X3 n=1 Tax=Dysidea avara TaxID=196820 RepID=UPI003318EF87